MNIYEIIINICKVRKQTRLFYELYRNILWMHSHVVILHMAFVHVVKRLSTIEPCKIENLCLKVLLIILVICRYFGNIPWYNIYVKKFHPTNYDMTKSIFSTLKWNEYERQLLINRITISGSECVKYLHENKGFFLKTFKSKDFCLKYNSLLCWPYSLTIYFCLYLVFVQFCRTKVPISVHCIQYLAKKVLERIILLSNRVHRTLSF